MIMIASIADDAAKIAETFGFWPQVFYSQVVSFLLVCALLYKFAYGPVQRMLDERRKTIETAEKNAVAVREQLEATEKRIGEMIREANGKAEVMLAEAKESAQQLSERQKQAAISEASQIIEKAQAAAKMESDAEMRKLKAEVGRLVVDTTARVLGKEMTPADHERITRETTSQIGA